jgi:hypothetical protein
MFQFDCKILRLTVAFAALLLIAGIALQLPRLLLEGTYPIAETLLSGIGLVAIVASPVVMIGTALLTLLPGVARRLALCEH